MIRALNDMVIAEVYKPENEKTTESGLILIDQAKERQYNGTVVSLGNDEAVAKSGLKVGDKIFYQKGQNFPITEDGIEYDCVSVFDVIAVKEE